MADNTVIWTGASGEKYTLYLYPIGNGYKALQGVYIFWKQGADRLWYPIYIGEAADLNDRLNTNLKLHHQWACITRNGATHICSMSTQGSTAQQRITIEADLRQGYPNSTCNQQ
ncbi:MAG TPA: hypothetical protein VGP42_06230 [Stellaceae bacterium]|jgi:hypothetical protein|nr:hypothetical protein [Stellaceae bacterium]